MTNWTFRGAEGVVGADGALGDIESSWDQNGVIQGTSRLNQLSYASGYIELLSCSLGTELVLRAVVIFVVGVHVETYIG